VARKDDKPVGFAIVEFADGATAEHTCNKLENLTIGGEKVELEMCVPGQTVPEAFSRQMSLLVRLVLPLVVSSYLSHCYFCCIYAVGQKNTLLYFCNNFAKTFHREMIIGTFVLQ